MITEATKERFAREVAKYPADQKQSAVMACLSIVQQEQGWVSAESEAVIADYALTESQLPAQRSQRIADYLRTQHPEAVHAVALATQSPAPVMRRLLEQVDERWGSAAGYLRAQGVTDAELAALSAALVEDASEPSTSSLPADARLGKPSFGVR